VIQAIHAERPAPAAFRQTILPPMQPVTPPLPPVPPAPIVGDGVLDVPSAARRQFGTAETEQTVLPIQEELPMPKEIPWRMVGELYRSYILVEQGDEAFLIDKHAAHERILFEKLRANPTDITSQTLLSPIPVRLRADGAAQLLAKAELMEELGFEIDEFGENTVLVRRVPMDLGEGEVADTLLQMADDLLSGRSADTDTVRDELLHTMACKAAIKAGWKTDEKELHSLVKEVMSRDELKYCPHGRPICITLSKKQLEKQFKRT
jgi:DNA mismatch repair protein MutL